MSALMITYTEYELKKIEKENKEQIMKLFIELNRNCEEAIRRNEELNARLFDIESKEYNRGYAEGMKRMLQTVESIFGRKENEE